MVSATKQVPDPSSGEAGNQPEVTRSPNPDHGHARTAPEHTDAISGALTGVPFRTRIWLRRARIVGLRVWRLVRTGLIRLLPGVRFLLRALHRRWRRSLQFRTVLTTLLLSIGSFAVVGAYLSNQIANNLFQERLTQAESETLYNVKQVQDTFDGAQVTDQSSVITLVYDTLNAVEGRGLSSSAVTCSRRCRNRRNRATAGWNHGPRTSSP